MKMLAIIFPLLVILAASCSSAKTITRCELAHVLLNANFSQEQLNDWVCLAEASSQLNTSALGITWGNFQAIGLFQISNQWWCEGAPKGKDVCGIKCSKLLDEDLSDDIECVRKIFNEHDFRGWNQWTNKCEGKDLTKYTKGCFDNMSTLDSLETTNSTSKLSVLIITTTINREEELQSPQDGYKTNANEMRERVNFGLIIANFAIYYMLIN